MPRVLVSKTQSSWAHSYVFFHAFIHNLTLCWMCSCICSVCSTGELASTLWAHLTSPQDYNFFSLTWFWVPLETRTFAHSTPIFLFYAFWEHPLFVQLKWWNESPLFWYVCAGTSSNGNGVNVGVIVGPLVGALVLGAAIALGLYCCCIKNPRKQELKREQLLRSSAAHSQDGEAFAPVCGKLIPSLLCCWNVYRC